LITFPQVMSTGVATGMAMSRRMSVAKDCSSRREAMRQNNDPA
jgi:hypothetical protein